MKQVKIILPMAAIALAAICASASTSQPLINDPVVIDGDILCTQIGTCTNPENPEAPACRNSQSQQLDVLTSATVCNVPARGTFTPKP